MTRSSWWKAPPTTSRPGLSGHDAAIKAMGELFGPIIGITLVLMSVFIPAAFLPGLTGRLYAQFALVIAATALISAINAATLKPTQCALWLRPTVPMEKRNWFYRGFNRGYGRLEHWYVGLIGAMTKHAGAMVVLALILMGGGIYGLGRLPTGFLPLEDQGYFLVSVQLPDSASLGRTQAVMAKLQKAVSAVPGVQDVVCISGISVLDNSASLSNAGVAYVILKDWSERTAASEGLLGMFQALTAAVAPIEEATTLVVPPPPIQGIGNSGGFSMQVELRDGSGDFSKLQSLTQTIVEQRAQPVRTGAVEHDHPNRGAADVGGGEPDEGGGVADFHRTGVPDAGDLCRIQFRRPDQQVRADVPGLCPGRRGVSR